MTFQRRGRWTIIIYSLILAFVAIYSLYAARNVINHPPSARTHFAAVGGLIYSLGGEDSSWNYLDEIVEIDPATGDAKVIGHLPGGRCRLAVVEVAGKIYAIGGWGHGGSLDELLELDPVSRSIRIVRHLPVTRADVAAAEANGKIYILGAASTLQADYLDQIEILELDLITGSTKKIRPRGFLWW